MKTDRRIPEARVSGLAARAATPSLASSVLLLLAVWSLLLSGRVWSHRLGSEETALLLCFGAATALMLWARPRRRRVSPIGRARRWTLALALALTLAAGCLGFPAWASLVAGIGLGIGLEPLPPRAPGAGGPLLWLATVVLAPVFEEILYRERLLLDLRGAMGAPCALAASTFAFAISHLDAWSVLATACIGLALGVLALVTRCVWLCVALHAGLNLASVLQGAPPVRLAPALATSAALGWTLLLSAVGLSLGTRSTQTPGPPEPR